MALSYEQLQCFCFRSAWPAAGGTSSCSTLPLLHTSQSTFPFLQFLQHFEVVLVLHIKNRRCVSAHAPAFLPFPCPRPARPVPVV